MNARARQTSVRARLHVRCYPEMLELMDALEVLGIELGGAPAIVLAVSTGADWYADALSEPEAWARFKVAFDVLRSGRAGYISPDSTTIGALAWVVALGAKFTEAVTLRMVKGRPVTH